MTRFFFDFISSKHGVIYIDEPTSFDGAEFLIEQEEGRHGRDVSGVVGGSNMIRLNSLPNHCMDIMLYNLDKFGFEAQVKFGANIDDEEILIGQVSFSTMKTDCVNYIEFLVTEVSERALYKRRYDAITNIFSNRTLDDLYIKPVETQNVLLKAKPIVQESKWNTPQAMVFTGALSQKANGTINTVNSGTNPAFGGVKSDIRNTLGFVARKTALTGGIPNIESFTYIEAAENLTNVKIQINNLNLEVWPTRTGFTGDIISATGYCKLIVRWGFDLATSNVEVLEFKQFANEETGTYKFQLDHIYTIASLKRGQRVWIYLENKVDVVFNSDDIVASYFIQNKYVTMDVSIEAVSTASNSVVPMVRVIDIIRHNTKSSCNLDITADRWDFGGEFYNQWVTTQSLMRGLTDKPFNVSSKDIVEEYLPEVNGDYQIQSDNKVFFGIETDFYRNIRMADFSPKNMSYEFGMPKDQINGFEKSMNRKFTNNIFKYSYKSYSSQKENEKENTYDVVHGESQWLLKNMLVQDSKEVEVGWIRDAFSIEDARRKAYDLSDTSATQDDDKKYLLDVVAITEEDRTHTDTRLLQHRFDDEENVLMLTNDKSFSWVLLGITQSTTFIIENGDNAGAYLVMGVEPNSIFLQAVSAQNINEQNTTFTYYISPDVTTLTNRTNEGFERIENIYEGNNYANLPFTVKRNVLKYYSSFLSTCLSRTENKEIKNTLYKNNPEALTQIIGGPEIIEASSFVPSMKILDIDYYKTTFLITLGDFLKLRDRIRVDNGYIRFVGSDGLPQNGFFCKAKWTYKSVGLLSADEIVGEMIAEMDIQYQEFYISIVGEPGGTIVIYGVDNTISPNYFDFDITNEKLYIFDDTGKQLQPGIPFDRVKVNNSGQATSVYELTQWLLPLKT